MDDGGAFLPSGNGQAGNPAKVAANYRRARSNTGITQAVSGRAIPSKPPTGSVHVGARTNLQALWAKLRGKN